MRVVPCAIAFTAKIAGWRVLDDVAARAWAGCRVQGARHRARSGLTRRSHGVGLSGGYIGIKNREKETIKRLQADALTEDLKIEVGTGEKEADMR